MNLRSAMKKSQKCQDVDATRGEVTGKKRLNVDRRTKVKRRRMSAKERLIEYVRIEAGTPSDGLDYATVVLGKILVPDSFYTWSGCFDAKTMRDAMPLLERMGLSIFVKQAWDIRSRSVCQEFICFQSEKVVFPADHRVHRVRFNKELFADLYNLPKPSQTCTSVPLTRHADTKVTDQLLSEFLPMPMSSNGWNVNYIEDQQVYAVFKILNSIFNPERPCYITKSTALAICRACKGEKPDWGEYLSRTFWWLTESMGAWGKCYLSPFLLHAYKALGLLTPAEMQLLGISSNVTAKPSRAQSLSRASPTVKEIDSARLQEDALLSQSRASQRDKGFASARVQKDAELPQQNEQSKKSARLQNELSPKSAGLQNELSQKSTGLQNDTLLSRSRASQRDKERASSGLQKEADSVLPQENELRKEVEYLRFQNGFLQNTVNSLKLCNSFLLSQEKESKDQRDAFEAQVERLYKEKLQWELQSKSQQSERGLRQEELQMLGGINIRLQDRNNKLQAQLQVLQKGWDEDKATWEKKFNNSQEIMALKSRLLLDSYKRKEVNEKQNRSLRDKVNTLQKKLERNMAS